MYLSSVMLFSGLGESGFSFVEIIHFSTFKACFSPSVPTTIRRIWGTHLLCILNCAINLSVD